MTVMATCALLALVGLAWVVRWGGADVEVPKPDASLDRLSAADVGRRYLRSVTLAVVSGVGAGILAAGAGGRLAMRLLAATAGDAAQGRETEAEEIVGRISVGGTIGFVVFVALFLGLATGAAYLLIRRWLPGGRLGGLTYGAMLLVLAATRVDPLRADNPDFDIVGPGWVAVTVFSAIVVVHGMLVAALAGRYSRVLPLLARDRRSVSAYAPLVVLVPVAPIVLPLAVVGALTVGLSRMVRLMAFLRSHSGLIAGRLVLVAAGLVALPGWISAVVDIAGRQA